MSEDDDDDVGYGKPPKRTQWKKGQSGNPRGRPMGARGLKSDLHEELSAKRSLPLKNKDGETKIISGTSQQLMLRSLATRARQGHVAAARVLIDLILQVFGPEDRNAERAQLSPHDQALLDQLLAQDERDAESPSAESGGDGANKPPQDGTVAGDEDPDDG